jgi:hypothetical protein
MGQYQSIAGVLIRHESIVKLNIATVSHECECVSSLSAISLPTNCMGPCQFWGNEDTSNNFPRQT